MTQYNQRVEVAGSNENVCRTFMCSVQSTKLCYWLLHISKWLIADLKQHTYYSIETFAAVSIFLLS